ncbi:hypothetical protein [Pseudomonas solani]|nr:hypothetical protein [Pseudomonas solani]
MNPIASISANGANIEHIIPKSKKIEFIFEPKNLCVICPDCNEVKRSQEVTGDEPNPLKRNAIQYPRTSGAFKIVHPHFDNYSEHIIHANRIYIDITPKGHWTIGACKLNRFYHRFGVCEELVEDVALIEEEEAFHKFHEQPI